MNIREQCLFRIIRSVGIAGSIGLLTLWALPAKAAPFTDNFDGLLVDLQARAATLVNSTDKTEQKQFKTIVKVAKTLVAKDSTSLATDIKNAGKIAKILVKSFPADFTPPGSSMATNLNDTFSGLADDVQTQIDGVQSNIDAVGASTCQDKAQAELDAAQAALDDAAIATDYGTAAKLLGTALKDLGKATKTAAGCTAGGGGGSDFVHAAILGTIHANFSTIPSVPPTFTIDTNTLTWTFNAGSPALGGLGIGFSVNNVTAPGDYPMFQSGAVTRLNPAGLWTFGDGTATFTTVDIAGQNLVGSFNFTGIQVVPSGEGMVTVTNGTFHITHIIIQ